MTRFHPIAADEKLDFGWDWSSTLPIDDALTNQVIEADTGVTVLSQATEGKETAFFCQVAGNVGERFNVKTRVTTAQGRTLSRVHRLQIVEAKFA